MRSASGAVAREILLADAANLLPNIFAPARGDEVKSAREKAEEQREAKLELVREQVRSGSLVIRQMTQEERRRYPRRPVSPKRPGWR